MRTPPVCHGGQVTVSAAAASSASATENDATRTTTQNERDRENDATENARDPRRATRPTPTRPRPIVGSDSWASSSGTCGPNAAGRSTRSARMRRTSLTSADTWSRARRAVPRSRPAREPSLRAARGWTTPWRPRRWPTFGPGCRAVAGGRGAGDHRAARRRRPDVLPLGGADRTCCGRPVAAAGGPTSRRPSAGGPASGGGDEASRHRCGGRRRRGPDPHPQPSHSRAVVCERDSSGRAGRHRHRRPGPRHGCRSGHRQGSEGAGGAVRDPRPTGHGVVAVGCARGSPLPRRARRCSSDDAANGWTRARFVRSCTRCWPISRTLRISARTGYGTARRPTSSKVVPTCASSRSCWDTRASRRRSSTPTCPWTACVGPTSRPTPAHDGRHDDLPGDRTLSCTTSPGPVDRSSTGSVDRPRRPAPSTGSVDRPRRPAPSTGLDRPARPPRTRTGSAWRPRDLSAMDNRPGGRRGPFDDRRP